MANVIRQNGIFKGFRARVFWTLTTLLLALSVFLTAIVIYQQGKYLKEDIIARGLSVLGYLADNSKLGVFTESSEFLEPVMGSVGLEKDFVYAVIYNLKWEVIAVRSSEKGVVPDITGELKERFDEKPLAFYQKTVYHGNELYEFWAPVLAAREFKGEDIIVGTSLLEPEQSLPAVSHGQDELKELKRQIGVVRVALSLNGIKSRRQQIIRNSIFITLLFLSAAFLVTYIAAKRITVPLLTLKRGVEAIEEGGSCERIEIDAVDEIGHLAASFNRMVESLTRKDEEITQHLKELYALISIAHAVNQSLGLQSTMQDALKEVLTVTGMQAGWIYLPDNNSKFLRVVAYRGVEDSFVKKIDLLEQGEGIAGKVVLSGVPIMLEDISGDSRATRGVVWDEGFKALASIPLRSKETLLGVMNLASRSPHPFMPDEAKLLHSTGGLIGTAIENSMLYEKVKKQLEEIESAHDTLVRTAKLASLGELSANVAHEINNPLTGVLTHTSMLMDDLPVTDPGQKRLRIIYDETMRIRYIVRNLLDFARQTEPRMEVVSVVEVIKDALLLVSHLAMIANVRIVEEYKLDNSPRVSVDVPQIKQVLLNLFNNAFYAMSNGGDLKIDVTTSNEWANIHIKDTGCGIPKDIINKVFDPFFTTKPETKGTGLGLSVSHGIIEKHGGKIEVDSEVGKGSIFTVKLPIAA